MLVVCLIEMFKSTSRVEMLKRAPTWLKWLKAAITGFGFFLISAPPFAALADLSTFKQGGQSSYRARVTS